MIHLLESDVCTYINYLEFFRMGDLSILPHLLIQLFINISNGLIYLLYTLGYIQILLLSFWPLEAHWELFHLAPAML